MVSTSVGVVVMITLAIRGLARKDCDGRESIIGIWLIDLNSSYFSSLAQLWKFYLRSCLKLKPPFSSRFRLWGLLNFPGIDFKYVTGCSFFKKINIQCMNQMAKTHKLLKRYPVPHWESGVECGAISPQILPRVIKPHIKPDQPQYM